MEHTTSARVSRPVTILCGFLGAGKTTLLKRLLENPRGVRFGVVVNDFGAINIDAALVARTSADQVALSNGCICCSMRDDLVGALESLLAMEPPPDRLIIEASGVSRPLAILDAVSQDAFSGRLSVDATICLVDAEQFPALDYRATELAIDQAGSSDLLVFNKCDLAIPADIAATESALLGPNPSIRHIRAIQADIPREILLGSDLSPRPPEAIRANHVCGPDCCHHHDDRDHITENMHTQIFRTWHWNHVEPLDWDRIRVAVGKLPSWVLRAKGVLNVITEGHPRRAVFQQVGKRHEVALEVGPPPDASDIVFIGMADQFDADVLQACIQESVGASGERAS
jgi:G3E family GTPase